MSVSTQAMQGALAYRQAVEDAGNFIDQQMRQYGWTSMGPNGQYSVMNAQDAFDPDRIVQFDTAGSPIVDTASITAATRRGQYGPTGAFAQAAQQGAAEEARALEEGRMRGFGRGSGLTMQSRLASERATQESMGGLSNQFLQSLIAQYQNVGRAYQGTTIGGVQGGIQSAMRRAGMTSLYNI